MSTEMMPAPIPQPVTVPVQAAQQMPVAPVPPRPDMYVAVAWDITQKKWVATVWTGPGEAVAWLQTNRTSVCNEAMFRMAGEGR